MEEKKSAPRGRPNRREEILAAVERLLSEHGAGGITTRAIAQEVPCSEGAIYVHFNDRLDLILAVFQKNLPEMLVPLRALETQAGLATPLKNLENATRGLLQFHQGVAPMLCSMLAEPELLARFQESLLEAGKGPERGIETIAHYIRQEQRIGRISREVKANTAARMLMASSFFHAFTNRLMGARETMDVKGLIRAVIR